MKLLAALVGLMIAGAANAQAFVSPMSSLPVYTQDGVLRTPSHVTLGQCTLVAGSCTVTFTAGAGFTDATTYRCTSSDNGLVATLSSMRNVSGSQVTAYGTLTDTINFLCIGW